ncbi:MAG TPA: hypothetical protein VH572_11695 [Gaiella sp.]|jgi:secreted PhoX family phosphatase
MRNLVRAVLVAAAVLATAVGTATALAADDDGFKTTQSPMLVPATTVLFPEPANPSQAPQPGAVAGVQVEALITVGDPALSGGYRFESIPDGISFAPRGGDDDDDDDDNRGKRSVDVYVNHETSTVPFPFNSSAAPEVNQNDFDNSQLSLLRLDTRSHGVLNGRMVITSGENFHRFCSNYMATRKEGFDRNILFTNEEAQDWVRRTGTSWEIPGFAPGASGTEQTGVVVAYDPENGRKRVIYGMGRHNHENNVAIPGYRDLVVLSGDDTFFTTPVGTTTTGTPPVVRTYNTTAWSQLYSYIADDTNDLLRDRGDLWAFVSETPGYDDYFDVAPGDTTPIRGRFVKVPKEIARGKNSAGKELLSTDFPGMLPPPEGVTGPPPDGPQWVLDQWGNAANNTAGKDGKGVNVFRFVRVEDIAYDKRPGMSNVVYIADSGRGRRSQDTDAYPTAFASTNGRIWKMVLNKRDPKIVESLTVLVEGDDSPVSNSTAPLNAAELAFGEMRQPDNLETTRRGSLLVTEDPGSTQQFAASSTNRFRTTARLWRVNLASSNPDADKGVVAVVDQAADEGPTDVDGAGANQPPAVVKANLGSWESSGIVDASSVFGRGWFLVDVQAHSLWVAKADGPDVLANFPGPDFTYKREGGQLLLIRIPGA